MAQSQLPTAIDRIWSVYGDLCFTKRSQSSWATVMIDFVSAVHGDWLSSRELLLSGWKSLFVGDWPQYKIWLLILIVFFIENVNFFFKRMKCKTKPIASLIFSGCICIRRCGYIWDKAHWADRIESSALPCAHVRERKPFGLIMLTPLWLRIPYISQKLLIPFPCRACKWWDWDCVYMSNHIKRISNSCLKG